MNLSFTACSFYIKKLYKKGFNDIYNLNKNICYEDTQGNLHNTNIKDMFKDFFMTSSTVPENKEVNKTFFCEYNDNNDCDCDRFVYYYAIIHSGNYGSVAEIVNKETREHMYTKKPDEADERPFYMYIVIPKDSEDVTVQKGLLFFQNVGPYGIKTLTTDYLRNYFSEKYRVALKINTVAPQLFIEKVLKKEAIKKMVMVKNHKSTDMSDNINNVGYGVETRTIAKLHFQDTAWNRIMDALRYSIKGQVSYFEFESKRYDGLKVIVDIGGRDRTVDIHNINNLSIIESIPDEIQDVDGLPNKDRLLAYFQKVTDEYLSKMVLQIK